MSLFDAAADITRPLGVKKPDPDLRWHEVDDLGVPGWGLNIGYTAECEVGEAPVIWIHRAELNTGQRVLELALNEIDCPALEAEISELVDAENEEAAKHAAHRRGCNCGECRAERADYEYDRRRDDKLTGDDR